MIAQLQLLSFPFSSIDKRKNCELFQMLYLTSSKLKDKIRFLFNQCRNNYYALLPLVQCPVQSTHSHTFFTKLYLILSSTTPVQLLPCCTFLLHSLHSLYLFIIHILQFCQTSRQNTLLLCCTILLLS